MPTTAADTVVVPAGYRWQVLIPTWAPTDLRRRYGVTATGFGYSWHLAEPRFDLAVNRNELNHFGSVVEIDPQSPANCVAEPAEFAETATQFWPGARNP